MIKRIVLFFICITVIPLCSGQFAWTDQSPAGMSDDIWSVTYGDEQFVAVTGKGRVLSSTDGSSWSVQTLSLDKWLTSVTYGGGLWVVVGEGGAIHYSADLKTWTLARAVTNDRLNGVAHFDRTFIAVGESGVIATSTDAQNWTLRNSGTTNFLRGITSNYPAEIISVGRRYGSRIIVTGGNGTVLSSSDFGVTWSTVELVNVSEDLEVAATGAVFGSEERRPVVVAGASGRVAFQSFYWDPILFADSQKLSGGPLFRGLAHGANQWVAGGTGGAIYTSPDGKNWTQRFSGDSPSTLSTDSILSVVYAEPLQKFVAVGGNGRVLGSSAPATTFVNVSTRGVVVPGDPVIGGFVISGTAQKNILIRAVGPTLSQFGVATALSDPVLTVYDSRGAVVATNTGWGTNSNLTALTAATLRNGFPLSAASKDSALYLTLPPGSYTAIIRSASNGTGTVLFEAYSN